ncbi:MAG TPA: RraA family protein [Planctomycetota bacterium]|nr:RraA family protein [Planctomycetota bacterium]
MISSPAALVRHFLAHSTCTVSDALDRLNLRGAPQGILPLWRGCPKIAGRAATMRLVAEGPASPVRGTLEAIAAASAGDVVVVDHGGRLDVNSFGGLASFAARRRRLAGVVIDGVTRDVDEMKGLRFPAFGRGVIQQSVRGRCAFAGRGIEVGLGGVLVRPGDLVLADDNGVVVVPWDRVEEVFRIVRECAAAEKKVKGLIAQGVDPVEAHERVRYERPAERGES